jgi:serum/glucocorticoid-regulated kinase 2
MLTGIPPFYDKNRNLILNKILKERHIEFKEYMTKEAKDLIKKLLVKDPKRRLGSKRGAEEIKEHPYFSCIDWELVEKR